jgi:hypothetical protein
MVVSFIDSRNKGRRSAAKHRKMFERKVLSSLNDDNYRLHREI